MGANLIQDNQEDSVERSKFANHIGPNFNMGWDHVKFSLEGGDWKLYFVNSFLQCPFQSKKKKII